MICFDRYQDGKKSMVTMSYDDGVEADIRLIEIFDRYGMRGSFHLNSGLFGQGNRLAEDQIAGVYKNHEISCHALTHPHLEKCPPATVVGEVLHDRMNLERVSGYPVRGMSYPFGTYNDSVITTLGQCGIVYSRTVASTGQFGLPGNFLAWNPTCHHKQCLEIAERYLANLPYIWRIPLFYVWGHSYEFDNDGNWDMIEEFCKRVSGHEDVWYATNIEIYDYLTAQRRLEISADERIVHNPSARDVWFSCKGETVCVKGGETLTL